MGKGTIQNHLGNGQYSVTLNFDNSGIDERISRLQTVISELDKRISVRLDDEQAAKDEMDSAWQDLQDAITVLSGIDPNEDPEAWRDQADTVTSLQEIYHQAYLIWVQSRAARRELESDKTSKQQRIALLEDNRLADKNIDAWCADYTTGLSGEVGIVEIPGERQHVQIRPGYNGAADYDSARDGAIVPIMATSPSATFYNLAMMPGWQKWRPGYRTGIIYNIDSSNDTCDVSLDEENSSIQGLGVNKESNLYDIPIEYMYCNATSFEDGNHVLVEFAENDWDSAKVIGFAEYPQMCYQTGVYVHYENVAMAVTRDGRYDSGRQKYRLEIRVYDGQWDQVKYIDYIYLPDDRRKKTTAYNWAIYIYCIDNEDPASCTQTREVTITLHTKYIAFSGEVTNYYYDEIWTFPLTVNADGEKWLWKSWWIYDFWDEGPWETRYLQGYYENIIE